MLHSLAFNQNDSCLGVGSEASYSIYNCEPFGECFHQDDEGGAKIVEMLFSTSLIATVGLGYKLSSSSRKLKIVNTKRNSVICELTFPTSILAVRINRKRLIVAIRDQVFIYDVSCMKLLHTMDCQCDNGNVIIDLSASDSSILVIKVGASTTTGSSVTAVPSTSTGDSPINSSATLPSSPSSSSSPSSPKLGTQGGGSVILFDALNIQPINLIQCHKSPLERIALSNDGTLLATASIKGTIIRVFSVTSGRNLYQFRRGTYPAQISSLRFKVDNTVLVCSSNTGTVHLFRIYGVTPSVPADSTEADNSSSDTSTIESSLRSHETIALPLPTIMADEETLEINRLINDRIDQQSSNSIAHKIFSRGKKSTKNLSKFLWSQSKNYLPTQINSILEPKRDFAFIRLPTEVESVVAVVGTNCYVATYGGDFFIYKIPVISKVGGERRSQECILLKRYEFADDGVSKAKQATVSR